MWYKLMPHATPQVRGMVAGQARATMFQLRDVSGQRLIFGNNWGDDYLKVPGDPSERQALEELMKENEWVISVQEKPPQPSQASGGLT